MSYRRFHSILSDSITLWSMSGNNSPSVFFSKSYSIYNTCSIRMLSILCTCKVAELLQNVENGNNTVLLPNSWKCNSLQCACPNRQKKAIRGFGKVHSLNQDIIKIYWSRWLLDFPVLKLHGGTGEHANGVFHLAVLLSEIKLPYRAAETAAF